LQLLQSLHSDHKVRKVRGHMYLCIYICKIVGIESVVYFFLFYSNMKYFTISWYFTICIV
jgi:hypothetical protein